MSALLLTALRQYRHNNGEGFVFAYDKEETDRIVAGLIEDRNQQYTTTQPAVQGELVGWVWQSYNQTNFTSGSHHKEVLEADGVKLTPVYTTPQPTPEVAKLVEALEVAHRFIANGIELGYIQMPDSDTLDPAHETLPAIEAALAEDAIRTYRKQGGDL